MMLVSVVLSTYSEAQWKHVSECISFIKKQSVQPDEVILVLDSNEKVITFYKKRFKKIKIIDSGKYGLSAARNAGVKYSKGDIIVFIDDDAIAENKWLEYNIRHYSDPDVVGVGGAIKAIWPQNRPFWFPEELDWIVGCTYKGHPEHITFIRNPIGCNMSFRKNVIERVGYFKEGIGRYGKTLLGSEETDISIRILESIPNSKIIYDPNSIVHHKVTRNRANIKYLLKRSFYEGISKSIVSSSYKKNGKKLSTETDYIYYLIRHSILRNLSKIYRMENLSHLFSILLSIFFVSVGFGMGKIKVNRNSPQ